MSLELNHFPARLQELMTSRRLSQGELARCPKVRQPTVNRNGARTDHSTAIMRTAFAVVIMLLLSGCETPDMAERERQADAWRAAAKARCDVRGFWPPAAISAGATGTTKLTFSVDDAGRATDLRLLESSGRSAAHKILDIAAFEFVLLCPQHLNTGGPRTDRKVVELKWELQEAQ